MSAELDVGWPWFLLPYAIAWGLMVGASDRIPQPHEEWIRAGRALAVGADMSRIATPVCYYFRG